MRYMISKLFIILFFSDCGKVENGERGVRGKESCMLGWQFSFTNYIRVINMFFCQSYEIHNTSW